MPNIDLYSLGIMSAATITAITSEATGFVKENLVDLNPDTYWKPTSTANQTIDIDLGIAQTVDLFAIWIHNYNTDYESGTQSIALHYDDNDDGNYSTTTIVSGGTFDNDVGEPIYIPTDPITPTTKRYWRVTLQNMTTIAEFSQFFLLQKNPISVYNELPVEGALEFFNSTSKANGGRQFVRGLTKAQMNPIIRSYTMADTDWTAFQAMFTDSQKNLYPLIIIEDSVNTYVRLGPEAVQFQKVQEAIYTVTVRFARVPFITDGENY